MLREREKPRATHILQRGDFLKPGKAVTPGVPAFLNGSPAGEPPSRLAFAKWLASRDSPTTARSLVNRVWQAYFGTGIVATSEDLGIQCEPPSHPELLDWLAVEFMENGWSLKHLHRLIANSATYRQSSRVTAPLLARDPYNRLLARGPRFRVDAEIVRDIALSASGLLDAKIGGPERVPAGAGVPVPAAGELRAQGLERSDRHRTISPRLLHVPLSLGSLSDAPGLRRPQRRLRLRAPRPVEYAAAGPGDPERADLPGMRTGTRACWMLERGGSTDFDRLVYAFRRCLARPPCEPEKSTLLELLNKQTAPVRGAGCRSLGRGRGRFAQAAAASRRREAARISRGGQSSRAVLLNLDETITKE